MLTKVAVFGTTHIHVEKPLFEGQEPIFELLHRGKLLSWYSTGKLEEALASGYTAYVCSIRPLFGPHDDWWQELVAKENVFFAKGLLTAMRRDGSVKAGFLAPWKALFERLQFPWDESFDDFDDPAIALSIRHGVRDGSMFTGHTLLC